VYDVKDTLNQKQNGLLAGENITITKGLKSDTISATGGGTTIDSTTDLSCNTLTTVGNASIGGTLTIGSETLDTKISNAITGKQNSITARNNLTITNDVLDLDEDVITNSLVIRPSFLKESYTPSVAGEIRATTLTIDDYVNGVVYDVKDTLIGKQDKLENTSNLDIKSLNVLSDYSAIITETSGKITCDNLSSGTLSTNGDATIGGVLTIGAETLDTIIDNKITASGGGSFSSGTGTVGFRAGRSATLLVNTNITLPFNTIIYNIGSAYDSSSYTFTAPVNGVYLFYCMLYTDGNNKYGVDFKRNNNGNVNTTLFRLQRTGTGAGNSSDITSSFTIELISGDKITMIRSSGSFYMYTEPFGYFGGHLLT